MFPSRKTIRQSVAASFMALAASQAGAELPVNAKGHADWLPISGPVENKVCPNRKKPGDWSVAFGEPFAKKDIVFVTTNSCQRRFMKINPTSGELLSLVSATELLGSAPVKVFNAKAAPDSWWQRNDLIPSKPQGEPSISGPEATEWMCQIAFGNSQKLQAAPGALVIPDATRAFYVFTKNDPSIKSEKINDRLSVSYGSEGKPFCTIDPLVMMPTNQNLASNRGGKWGGIGDIGKAPRPNIEPAFLPLAIPVAMGIEQLSLWALGASTVVIYGNWLKDHPAVITNNVIVIPEGGHFINGVVDMSGLSPAEVGRVLAVQNQAGENCEDEIREAEKICRDLMSKPNPPLGVIGRGTKTVDDCKKGLISERCGGNRVSP